MTSSKIFFHKIGVISWDQQRTTLSTFICIPIFIFSLTTRFFYVTFRFTPILHKTSSMIFVSDSIWGRNEYPVSERPLMINWFIVSAGFFNTEVYDIDSLYRGNFSQNTFSMFSRMCEGWVSSIIYGTVDSIFEFTFCMVSFRKWFSCFSNNEVNLASDSKIVQLIHLSQLQRKFFLLLSNTTSSAVSENTSNISHTWYQSCHHRSQLCDTLDSCHTSKRWFENQRVFVKPFNMKLFNFHWAHSVFHSSYTFSILYFL